MNAKQFDPYTGRSRWYFVWRSVRFFFQQLWRGWDDSQTWNMDISLSDLILPRLRRFKELTMCYPHELTPEKWDECLDEMIFAFDYLSQDILDRIETPEVSDKVQHGLDLFAHYYRDLWW